MNERSSNDEYEAAMWNWNGVCPRKSENIHYVTPSISGMSKISVLNVVSILNLFDVSPKEIYRRSSFSRNK